MLQKLSAALELCKDWIGLLARPVYQHLMTHEPVHGLTLELAHELTF